jgi:hypothetical protein
VIAATEAGEEAEAETVEVATAAEADGKQQHEQKK